jgi:hypothetical protein
VKGSSGTRSSSAGSRDFMSGRRLPSRGSVPADTGPLVLHPPSVPLEAVSKGGQAPQGLGASPPFEAASYLVVGLRWVACEEFGDKSQYSR